MAHQAPDLLRRCRCFAQGGGERVFLIARAVVGLAAVTALTFLSSDLVRAFPGDTAAGRVFGLAGSFTCNGCDLGGNSPKMLRNIIDAGF